MKTFKILTLLLTGVLLNNISAQNCNAVGGAYNSSTNGVVQILDSSSTSSGSAATYSWITFYDSNGNYISTVSLQPSTNYTTYTFSSNGTYTYYLEVNDSITNCYDSIGGSVTITGLNGNTSGSCDASFTSFLDSNSCNTIFYQASSTGYTNYYWDFGDGNYSNNTISGAHTYSADGTYTIELAVYNYDSLGNYICADTVYNTVSIACNGSNSNCDASAMLVDSSGYLFGIPSTYSSTYNYYWDFGDGNTSTQAYPWHQYANPGTYTVCLSVIDSVNICSDSQCYTYTVVAPTSCNASFYLFQDSVNAGLYYAWNMSTGNNLSYSWGFGDGNTSTQQFPTHTYTTVGVYSLCLTVDDGNGCVDTFCDTINVVVKSNGTTIQVTPAGQASAVEENTIGEVKLYPNPSNGNVNLIFNQSTQVSLEVLNYVGQIVYQQPISATSGGVITFDLSQQPAGIYIIRLFDGKNGSVQNLKLIKQ